MDGDAWLLPEIGFDKLHIHPAHIVDPDDLALVDAWRGYSSEFGGGHLPCAGGYFDQPAYTMDCFNAIEGAFQALRQNRGTAD